MTSRTVQLVVSAGIGIGRLDSLTFRKSIAFLVVDERQVEPSRKAALKMLPRRLERFPRRRECLAIPTCGDQHLVRRNEVLRAAIDVGVLAFAGIERQSAIVAQKRDSILGERRGDRARRNVLFVISRENFVRILERVGSVLAHHNQIGANIRRRHSPRRIAVFKSLSGSHVLAALHKRIDDA